MKKISTKNAPEAIGPYSQGILVNNFLYVSGQIAIDPKNLKLVNGNIKEETIQVMNNLKEILYESKMSFNNVIKTSIFIKNINNFKIINNIYSLYFKNNKKYPSRETIEVSNLPKNANVEISLIAYKK